MPRALISVHDKTGLVEFAAALVQYGWDLVASGGTEKVLRDAGLEVTSIEQVTGVPELLGGRVKTLHPAVHAGILARDHEADFEALRQAGYAPINMVVCNLYPFQETVRRANITLQDAIEQIDIGGVALLRAAAKNFIRVIAASSPADYPAILESLEHSGQVDLATRRDLAIKAFALTRDYDTAIHAFMAQDSTPSLLAEPNASLPAHLSIGASLAAELRYGENPHQSAAYYSRGAKSDPLGGTVLGGKTLSYNNILDLDAAWRTVSMFTEPTVVIVKHLTPAGIASASSLAAAYPEALASDPVSAFGGVIAVNRIVDDAFAEALGSLFLEAIAAPAFSASVQALFAEKRKNCRLLQIPSFYDGREFEVRSVHRGLLVQMLDMGDPDGTGFKTVTRRSPTAQEIAGLRFAWKAVQHVKSNAIVIANDHTTLGIGGGLPSRVDAVKLAISKAANRASNAVLASDAFFPFADGVEAAAEAGIRAIIQPGGSIRDNEVIEAADRADIAMVFTNVRHFRH
ncbi:MAG: bifunctional phosphoribosylaminoimidazolecarboxamide formyltransferase/IMP cyclohydrolase [bacterium]|nr:bifunctional phosphoribosylaminoimidazolecarboxamide formyltransferase/IMP cyclohydrolase [bacterium]